ncbi:MAG: M28 family metallopeptidase [Lutibacter sp.]
MKKIIYTSIIFLLIGCAGNTTIFTNQNVTLSTNNTAIDYGNLINSNDLRTLLTPFASDEFEGRKTGEPGQKKAADFIKNFYIKNQIKSPFGGSDYFQAISSSHLKPGLNNSENVVGFIEGSEFPEEIIVLSAHYDHLGIKNGNIYNGADDDGSGSMALLAIAKAFQQAKQNGYKPKRSLLFIHFTGEEEGLLGSQYYSEFPIFPLKNTIADLNIDMIGRIDNQHNNQPNYIYLIGSDKLSNELHQLSEKINNQFVHLSLDYRYNSDDDPNRFYYRSDHYNFAKNNIPVIFYFNGTHNDYHQPTDTADKINYDLLAKRAQLVFYTAWELANREKRIELNN